MKGLNISEKCQQEWEQTLNVSNYKKIDDQLAVRLAKFLSGNNIINLQNNPSLFSEIVRDLAKIMGVSVSNIRYIYEENSSLIGGYISDDKSIVLNFSTNNLTNLTKAEFVNTVIHELRHAQQHQYIIHLKNYELGQKMKQNLDNYTQPGGSIIKDAKYYSNFAEVDAELFSHIYTEDLLKQLQEKSFLSEYKSAISRAVLSHGESHTKFKRQLEESLKVVDINNKAISNITNLLTSYSKMMLDKKFSPEQITELEENIINQCEIIFSGNAKEFVDFTDGHFKYIQKTMYENINAIELARNLDRPFVKYFEKLEDRYDRFALDRYGKYTRRLRSIVDECKKFLDAHGLPYNEKDNGDIIEQVIDTMPKVYLENFVNQSNISQMKKDNDLCSRIDIYVTKDKNYLHLQCAKYIEENLPKKQIRKRLEEFVDREENTDYMSDMLRDLLSGYAIDYGMEKISHTREKFLAFLGIKCKSGEFSEIYDKTEDELPKFIAKTLFKEKLTKEEEQYLVSVGWGCYGKIDTEKLKRAIDKQFMSKSKLKKLFTGEISKNKVVETLEKRKINLQELLAEKSSSKGEYGK